MQADVMYSSTLIKQSIDMISLLWWYLIVFIYVALSIYAWSQWNSLIHNQQIAWSYTCILNFNPSGEICTPTFPSVNVLVRLNELWPEDPHSFIVHQICFTSAYPHMFPPKIRNRKQLSGLQLVITQSVLCICVVFPIGHANTVNGSIKISHYLPWCGLHATRHHSLNR